MLGRQEPHWGRGSVSSTGAGSEVVDMLKPGMVVSNNGTNLLSALRQGKLTHVPCFAHVLNLVVQESLCAFPKVI